MRRPSFFVRRRSVQELRAAAREVEQLSLAADVGVCPFDGLCEACLDTLAQNDEERDAEDLLRAIRDDSA